YLLEEKAKMQVHGHVFARERFERDRRIALCGRMGYHAVEQFAGRAAAAVRLVHPELGDIIGMLAVPPVPVHAVYLHDRAAVAHQLREQRPWDSTQHFSVPQGVEKLPERAETG